MAAAIHQTMGCGITKEGCMNRTTSKSSKPSPWHSQKVSGKPLWMDNWGDKKLTEFRSQDTLSTVELDSLVVSLRACARNKDLVRGTSIHDDLLQRGLLKNCSDALITMYATCGELEKAKALLDLHKSNDAITWTALIAGYAREGQGHTALDCLEQMQHDGILPSAVTFVCALKACAMVQAVDKGKQFHDEIVRQGLLQNNIVLGGALVDMYAKCKAVSEAQRVLKELPSRNVITWNALISGYTHEGLADLALSCLEQMQNEDILPNAVTYACSLKACAMIRAARRGKQIHKEIIKQGLLQNDIVLGNALVDMYCKCGNVSKARQLLEELCFRDVVSWNALIAGYAQEGEAEKALSCFEQMQHEGIPPDAVTYVCALKACAIIRAIGRGKQIHEEIVRQGMLQSNLMLGNVLVDLYAKCGDVLWAQQVLRELPCRDVISWNALIAGYAKEGEAEKALDCVEQMQHEGILPDAVTYASMLKACTAIRASGRGEQIHEEIMRQGLLQNNIVLGNALVDMYAKCGILSGARQVLEELPQRNVVTWSALIAGYVQEGEAEQALNCLEQMQLEGIPPEPVTYAYALKACAMHRAVGKGKKIHKEIARQGLLRNDIVLGNALVDMYAKCGEVLEAHRVLENLPSTDVFSWNALIAGYAQEGEAEQAVRCLDQMQHKGILPDVVTIACVLNVCSHRGLVKEGQELFLNMSTKYSVEPNLECYTCMIDLFGRAGHLEKAVRLIQEMPSSDLTAVWHALLDACRKWADVIVGGWAFKQAVRLDESDGSAYVLMASIYAAAGMEEKAKSFKAMRVRNEAWKKQEQRWRTDPSNIVPEFSVGNTKYTQDNGSEIIKSCISAL